MSTSCMVPCPNACLLIALSNQHSEPLGTHDAANAMLSLCIEAKSNQVRSKNPEESSSTSLDEAGQRLSAVWSQMAVDETLSLQAQLHERLLMRRAELLDAAQLVDVALTDNSLREHQPPPLAGLSTPARSPTSSNGAQGGADWLLHEFYASRCTSLGVRTQRAVVEALAKATSQRGMVSADVSLRIGHAATTELPKRPTSTPTRSHVGRHHVSLDLSRVLLGKRGIVPLLDTLECMGVASLRYSVGITRNAPAVLEELNLSGCGLSDQAVECLAVLIALYFPELRVLDLSHNSAVGARSGNSVLDLLTSSPWGQLESILLTGTNVRPATVRTIDGVLEARKTHQ